MGCWDTGIEWCAKEGVGGTPAKTERLWLGLRQQMAGCGVNALGVTYLCEVMWSLDAGIKRRAKEGSWRHPSKIERPWLGFRERTAGDGVNALGGGPIQVRDSWVEGWGCLISCRRGLVGLVVHT